MTTRRHRGYEFEVRRYTTHVVVWLADDMDKIMKAPTSFDWQELADDIIYEIELPPGSKTYWNRGIN